MKKITITESELKELYKDKNLTLYQIAEIFNCSPALISIKLKALGIDTWWKPVNVPEDKLRSLYEKQKLTVAQIAKRCGCGQTTIVSKMRKFNLKARPKSEISTKYPKSDFSGDLAEKAYLIGFRLGDLHIRPHSKLISVETTTTRPEQVKLLRSLFSKYTHLSFRGNKKMASYVYVSCLLNDSFKFLLNKNDEIENWILESDNLFLAFLAGYIDAEGCIGIYSNKNKKLYPVLILRTYDKGILSQLWSKLMDLGIKCPQPRLSALAGTQNNNKDFWRLGIYRKKSLNELFDLLNPYIKHPKRKKMLKKAKQITER